MKISDEPARLFVGDLDGSVCRIASILVEQKVQGVRFGERAFQRLNNLGNVLKLSSVESPLMNRVPIQVEHIDGGEDYRRLPYVGELRMSYAFYLGRLLRYIGFKFCHGSLSIYLKVRFARALG
jgi:hypothetical protein